MPTSQAPSISDLSFPLNENSSLGISEPIISLKPLSLVYNNGIQNKELGGYANDSLFFNGCQILFTDSKGVKWSIACGRVGFPLSSIQLAILMGDKDFKKESEEYYKELAYNWKALGSQIKGYAIPYSEIQEGKDFNIQNLQASLNFIVEGISDVSGGEIYPEDIRGETYTDEKGNMHAQFVAVLYHGNGTNGHRVTVALADTIIGPNLPVNQEVILKAIYRGERSIKNPGLPVRFIDSNGKPSHYMFARSMKLDEMKKILIYVNDSDNPYDYYHLIEDDNQKYLSGIDFNDDNPFGLPSNTIRIAIASNALDIDLNEVFSQGIPPELENEKRHLEIIMMHYVEKDSITEHELYKGALAVISHVDNKPSTLRVEGIIKDFITRKNYPEMWRHITPVITDKDEITFPTGNIAKVDDNYLFYGGIGDQANAYFEAKSEDIYSVIRKMFIKI